MKMSQKSMSNRGSTNWLVNVYKLQMLKELVKTVSDTPPMTRSNNLMILDRFH